MKLKQQNALCHVPCAGKVHVVTVLFPSFACVFVTCATSSIAQFVLDRKQGCCQLAVATVAVVYRTAPSTLSRTCLHQGNA